MHKYFKSDKINSRKIKGIQVEKSLSEKDLKNLHRNITEDLNFARSSLKRAVMTSLYVVGIDVKENDVEKMIDILIQRPDKCANNLFAFADAVKAKIETK